MRQEVQKTTLQQLNAAAHKDRWVSLDACIWNWRHTAPTPEPRINTREG